MPNTKLRTPSPARLPRLALALASAGALLSGCTIIVGDHDDHDDAAWERCYDEYDECLDAADGDMDAVRACGDALEACSPEGGAVAPQDPPNGGDTHGGDTSPPAVEVCVALHKTCIAGADDLAETLACEALFDHCAHPDACQDACHEACPAAELDLCLGDYGACVDAANHDAEVDVCNATFAGCIDDAGAAACLPADDAALDVCLAEHALCTACAQGAEELAACKAVFDACVSPPM